MLFRSVQTSVSAFTPPPCSLSSYAAASVAYSWDAFAGVPCPTGDDDIYNGFGDFGFTFCFAGQQFSGAYLSSNGAVIFAGITCFPNINPMPGASYAAPGVWTGWSISTPAPTNADYTPRNAILASSEIKLFETSNNIEIHVRDKNLCVGWNSGRAIMGLHNYDGTIYIPPVNMVNHNSPTQWTMANTAYRFTTSCPSQSICGVVLPIGFKSFTGQQIDGLNKLWWETSDETEVKEFIVERCLDGLNFNPIALIESTNKPSMHTYSDNTFERGYVNYYRITAVNKDASKISTSIYAVFNTDDKILITSVYPNPASDRLTVSMNGRGANADCEFIIYDQYGRIVNKTATSIGMGPGQVDLDIISLEKGIYILEIKANGNSVISKQKFSKQ